MSTATHAQNFWCGREDLLGYNGNCSHITVLPKLKEEGGKFMPEPFEHVGGKLRIPIARG